MKVLFFIDGLWSGGKERRLVELIKGLSKYPDMEMKLVLTKTEVHYEEIFLTGIEIFYLVRNFKKDPSIFFKFYKIALNFKPDIIHVWSNVAAIYAIPAKFILKIPMINNEITNSSVKKSIGILNHRLSFPFSDRIVANTFAGLDAYLAPKKKSSVIYNGFDFMRISGLDNKEEIKKKFNISTKYVVGMVASFNHKKDYLTFIKAAKLILANEHEITFICVGKGENVIFENMVSGKNSKYILFLGQQKYVESIMNICDIGVLMTNDIHGEGISNAILEFAALGKPVIASNGGGNVEIIENNINGFLIRSHSPEELADKVLFLINNSEYRLAMGKRSVQIVKDKFGISRMIDEFKELYDDVLNLRKI